MLFPLSRFAAINAKTFKVTRRVICVDNSAIPFFTIGKEYDVLGVDCGKLLIKDDCSGLVMLLARYFKAVPLNNYD